MKRSHAIVGFVLVALLASALPALEASPSKLAKQALKLAKKADKRSKQALAKAGTPGPRGPQGPQGVQGASGQAVGPAGGDLDGTYPNPTLADGSVSTSKLGTVPAVRATRAGVQTVGDGGGTNTVVSFDKEIFDTANMHDNVTTNFKLVAPVTGIYEVTASIVWVGATGGNRDISIQDSDNNLVANETTPAPTNAPIYQHLTSLVRLDATDNVKLVVNQTSGGDLDIFRSPPGGEDPAITPEFSLHYVGPAS